MFKPFWSRKRLLKIRIITRLYGISKNKHKNFILTRASTMFRYFLLGRILQHAGGLYKI